MVNCLKYESIKLLLYLFSDALVGQIIVKATKWTLEKELCSKIISILETYDGLPLYEIAHKIKKKFNLTSKLLNYLIDENSIITEKHGRHVYYCYKNAKYNQEHSHLKNELIQVICSNGDSSLQKARTCYGHLAGKLGILFFQYLLKENLITPHLNNEIILTDKGINTFSSIKLNLSYRCTGKSCLDYTERYYHLGGNLAKVITMHLYAMNWFYQLPNSRILKLTPTGKNGIAQLFNLKL